MKDIYKIDKNIITVKSENGTTKTLDLYSKEAFELVSDLWMKLSWNQKYSYTFTWLGRPLIQHPEDVLRLQESIYKIKPDVIIETGIAHGGSLIFYASLFEAMGHGRVIGVDIEIRQHNRAAIETHPLFKRISLIEGSSTDPHVVAEVEKLLNPDDKVMVILDSNHSKEHVLNELKAYHGFTSPGSYILATDGIMEDLTDVPRGHEEWKSDNPAAAAREFVKGRPEYEITPPPWLFNESNLEHNITGWKDAWIFKKS